MKALAITDCRISPACERSLLVRGFFVIKLPPSSRLPAPIASHPDMLMLSHSNTIITSCDYCEEATYIFSDIREFVPQSKIIFTDEASIPKYPKDAIFNSLIIGDKMFCKTDTVSRSVLEYAKEQGFSIRHVNQGYPACTTLPLGDSHAITADRGMANALESENIDVTLINNGNISLPPYDYGFIGGCAGFFENTVYFLGNPGTHPNGEIIISACKSAGLEVVSLSDEPLCDLGRIIFI